MKLNYQQQTALIDGFHQLVVANAGSGKTAVLVEKFFQLINKYPVDDLQKVVAITFTRKAASEMQERIVKKINDLIKSYVNKPKDSYYFKLILLRERISSAKIQTIHSFCQEILSEYAINLGYNPNFAVIEEYHFKKIFKDAFNIVLEDVLETDENYSLLFEVISERKFEDIVFYLIENYILFDEIALFYSKSDQEIIEDIKQQYLTIVRDLMLKYENLLLLEIGVFNNTSNANSFVDNFKKLFEAIKENNLIATEFYLDKLMSIKHKGNSKYLKYILRNDYEFLKVLRKEINLYFIENNGNLLIEFIDLLKKIVDFTQKVIAKVESYKKRNSVITYNDMINKVLELLKDAEIVNKIANKYDYFLIDEFQDTDFLQFKIFEQLAFGSQQKHKFLFLVGDPKQSIYGFRNADVRVLYAAQNLIKNRNQQIIEFPNLNPYSVPSDTIVKNNYGLLELSLSYRLNVANTAFVNFVFENVLNSEKVTGYEVDYTPLIYARENPFLYEIDDQLTPYLNDIKKTGGVKFLITIEKNQTKNNSQAAEKEENDDEPETDESEIDPEQEASSVSDFVKYLINSKLEIYDTSLRTIRPIKFSDVAILVRKNKHINNIAKALDRNKIPFVLTGAEDFFGAQEIIDIISYLNFINNPESNFYFMATAKSYFFGISDQTLYDILANANTEKKTYWEIFSDLVKSDDSIDFQIRRFVEITTDVLEKKEFYTVHDIVAYILSKTNYEIVFASFAARNMIMQNILKFKTLVQKLSNQGINSIGELLTELHYIAEMSDYGTEASYSTENAVNILTIHKAKGLEFPVVIIYHSNFNPNKHTRLAFYRNKLPYFYFNSFNNETRSKSPTPLYNFIRRRQKNIEEEEEKRLFYVAATRAKDLLIISSYLKPDSKSNKYSPSMEKGFGKFYFPLFFPKEDKDGKFEIIIDIQEILEKIFNIEEKNVELEKNDIIKNFSHNLKINVNDIEIEKQIIVPVEFLYNFKYKLGLDYTEDKQPFEPILLLDKVEYPLQEQFLSATKLQTFTRNQNKYFLRYILGFNTDLLEIPNKSFDQEQLISGKDRGNIIHQTIAQCPEWLHMDGIDQESLRRIVKKVYGLPTNDEIVEEVVEEVLRVFNQDFLVERRDLILNSKFEIPFSYYWQNKYLEIIIDLLYEDKNGNYEIWDWKNNLITNDEDYNQAIEKYAIQMQFYSWLISKYKPEQKEYTARLFFTRLAGRDNRWMKVFHWDIEQLTKFEQWLWEISEKMQDAKSIDFSNL